MKKALTFFVFLSFFILFSISNVQGQVDTLWTKTFGGSDNERGSSVQQTTDGGYIIVGITEFFGVDSDIWLIKTNSFGDTLWTRKFGGSEMDGAYSVKQTSDGGYIITGTTSSFGAGCGDVWLIKTDASGDTLWTKTFGGSDCEASYSVQQTTDGGYIIIGLKGPFWSSYAWLIKTNTSGDTLWTKKFEASFGDEVILYSVQQTTDGGYIITGYTNLFGAVGYDVLLIKTNASGDTLWTKTMGGSDRDVGNSVQQTTDGGYIIVGHSFSAGDQDVWMIKTNASGDTLWTKTFGGSGWEDGKSVQQTTDGGYVIVGYTDSFGAGSFDIWLIKTNVSGDTLWTKIFGGSDYEESYSVQQTTDGGYVITGLTESFGAGEEDVWLIKTTPDVSDVEPNTDLLPLDFSLHQNYPNPFNSSTRIQYAISIRQFVKLTVYDVLGNEIATLVNEQKPAGIYEVTWYAENLPSGVYFYQLKAGNYMDTKKMVLLK